MMVVYKIFFVLFIFWKSCSGELFNKKTEDCKENADCEIVSSVCKSGQCICQQGYVMTSDMTQCLPESNGYGSNCEDSAQCSAVLLTGGKCVNQKCLCAEGYHYFQGRCWKTVGIGEKCSKNENCFVGFDFEASVCSSKKICKCSEGYYEREYSSCRPISKESGEPCAITMDCHYENSLCLKNRTCGFINETDDYPPPQPLPPPLNGSSTVIGNNCNSGSDCKSVKNAICNELGKCTCAKGFFEASDSLCYPEIGSKCSSNSDCIGWFMTCKESEKVCICKEGYVAEADNHNCTKMSRYLGWSCLEDRWCALFGPGGTCVDKKCQCSSGTHFIESQSYCWVSKSVGSSCIQSLDCGNGDGKSEACQNGICKCLSGFHSSSDNSTCHQDSQNVDDPCIEDIDCLYSHSRCDKKLKKCSCLDGYMVKDKKCVSGVGGYCDNKTNCFADGSLCNITNHECECRKSFVSNVHFSKCLPVATHYLSDCIESQQCSELLGCYSNCDDKHQCSCKSGYHNIDNYCYLDVKLYQKCQATAECQKFNTFTECRNELCLCKFGHRPDAFNATCTGGSWHLLPSSLVFILSYLIILKI